jgi:hypothetical protein
MISRVSNLFRREINMNWRAWIMAFAVVAAAVGCVGCGSSDSADAPTDMDETVARVERQRASAAPESASGSETTALAAATPAATGVPPAASAPDPALPSKRGFDLEDWSNEAAYVLVKGDAVKLAESLARELKGTVVKDVLGKAVNERAQAVVYQLAGHSWSIFACDNSQLEKLAPALSRGADVLVFWQSDFNGWAGVELYRGGEQVEAVHWGTAEDSLGEDADASKWDSRGQFVRTFEGISMTDAFLFRSKLRNVTPDELNKGDAFIDSFLRHHDAYLPDADQMPWFDYDTKLISSPLGAAAFAGVHAVEVAGP